MTHSRVTTWLWKHLHNNVFEKNAFIINNELLKSNIWINQLIRLLRNSKIHIEFHSKLFKVTKHGLKNKIIKLIVKFFLWNLNQMVVTNFWRVRIGPCFPKSFWNDFFSFIKFFVPHEYIIEYVIGLLFLWTL